MSNSSPIKPKLEPTSSYNEEGFNDTFKSNSSLNGNTKHVDEKGVMTENIHEDRIAVKLECLNDDEDHEMFMPVEVVMNEASDNDVENDEDVPDCEHSNSGDNENCQEDESMYTVTPMNIRSNSEKQYKCKTCHYCCTKKSLMATHVRVHTRKSFNCEICQYKCSRKIDVERHMLTHTGEKPFSCELCPFRSAWKRALERHMSYHADGKLISCELCEYKSMRKCNMKRHIQTHTPEKLFSCTVCQYKCSTKADLKNHIDKNHTGEKPHSCDFCGYKCKQKTQLRIHMMMHAGEKP